MGLRVAAKEGVFPEASLTRRKRKEKLTTGWRAGETLSVQGPRALLAGKFKALQWGKEGHLRASEHGAGGRKH